MLAALTVAVHAALRFLRFLGMGEIPPFFNKAPLPSGVNFYPSSP
jgi:hypothetical protein